VKQNFTNWGSPGSLKVTEGHIQLPISHL